jgi:hypothetical protein
MLKKTASSLTAQKLRIILVATIFLLIALAGVVFFFARNTLDTYAADVHKMTKAAESSSQNLAALNSLKAKLAENKEAVERAKSLVAESQYYAYQDQIIKDINTFAAKSGVAISGYQFNGEATAGAGAAPAAAPTPAAGAPVEGGAATATPGATVSGLKSTSVAITLDKPLSFEQIMRFVNMIEQNLTKMQLAGVSIAKDPESSNGVAVNSLTIEVYVK